MPIILPSLFFINTYIDFFFIKIDSEDNGEATTREV